MFFGFVLICLYYCCAAEL